MTADGRPSPTVPAPWVVRPLAWLVPFWLTGCRLSSSGVGPFSLLLALLLTLGFYAAFNRWAAARIDGQYESLILSEFASAASGADAADRAVRLRWADDRLQGWLPDVLAVPSPSFPAHRQADALFLADYPSPEAAEQRQAILRDAATGRRRPDPLLVRLGLPPEVYVVSLAPATGADVFAEMTAVDGGSWEKAVESRRGLAEEKKQFITRYLEAVVRQSQGPVRDMQRLNGWVQWLTVFVAALLLVVLLRRWLMLVKLRYASATASLPQSSELTAVALAAPSQARQLLEPVRDGVEGAYATLGYLATVLPSLGFLGTVMGLGDALLRADGLFAEQNKQRTITLITQDLGFAFDTTLVALVAGLVVGLPLAFLRQKDRRLLRDWDKATLARASG